MFEMKLELQEEGLVGVVHMKVPRHTERLRVLAECGATKLKQQTQDATDAEKVALFEQNTPVILDVYEKAARALIVDVEVKRGDEVLVKGLEQAEVHPITTMLPLQVAAQYLAGFGPGNS